MKSCSPFVYMLSCASLLTGCAAYDAIGVYAKEHNLRGERVCDSTLPTVVRSDAPPGCPSRAVDDNDGVIPNVKEKEAIEEGAL